MTRYIYKKVHIDKDDPTATVSIPDDAINVDVAYGVYAMPGHMTVQWLEPDPVAKTAAEEARIKAIEEEWKRTQHDGFKLSIECGNRDRITAKRNGVRIFMDGDMWCAVNDDFVDIQESVAGFGKTPDIALAELLNKNKTHLQ